MSSASSTYIFIDTCSLLDSCWNGDERKGELIVYDKAKESTFWNVEFESLLHMSKVIVPRRNYEELIKLSKHRNDPMLRERCKHTLSKINTLLTSHKIEIVGDSNDPFADAVLLSVALKFRTRHNLAFITQDRNLAMDLKSIAEFKSVRPRDGNELKVRRINKAGRIEKWHDCVNVNGDKSKKSGLNVGQVLPKTLVLPKAQLRPWWED